MAVTLDGLHPTLMRPRVEAVLADPEAKAIGLYVVSAFRSVARQRELYLAAVRKYGSERAARKWVAPPGRSNHGPSLDDAGHKVQDQISDGRWGGAVDLGVPGYKAVTGQWPADLERKVNAICNRHGLHSPMDWEDWHFEPIPNWKPPAAKEDVLMRSEVIIVVPEPSIEGRQLVSHDKDGKRLPKWATVSSVQVCASRYGDLTRLLVQPTRYGEDLVLAVALLDGSPAPRGAEARVLIEHR